MMNEEQARALLEWMSDRSVWAAPVLFLLFFAEGVIGVGFMIPLSIFMVGLGVLIGAGILDFSWVVLGATAGAAAGASVGYMLGAFFKDRLPTVWPFSRHRRALERARGFVERWGEIGVFLGRFTKPLRIMTPVVVGMLGMPPGRFLLFNLTSAPLWVVTYLMIGIMAGRYLSPQEMLLLFALYLGVVLLALFLWGFYQARRR